MLLSRVYTAEFLILTTLNKSFGGKVVTKLKHIEYALKIIDQRGNSNYPEGYVSIAYTVIKMNSDFRAVKCFEDITNPVTGIGPLALQTEDWLIVSGPHFKVDKTKGILCVAGCSDTDHTTISWKPKNPAEGIEEAEKLADSIHEALREWDQEAESSKLFGTSRFETLTSLTWYEWSGKRMNSVKDFIVKPKIRREKV